MTQPNEDAEILAAWSGEEQVYQHLEAQLAELCPVVCGADAPAPVLQLKPTFLASGLMGDRRSGADYEPEDGDFPATIGIFPMVLRDKQKVRCVLAHELIHHWEHLDAKGAGTLSYPPEADALIAARYSGHLADRRWRSGHSQVFVSKAAEVARYLNVPLQDLLFERRKV